MTQTPEVLASRAVRSDWERAHDLLDEAGVLTNKESRVGAHLIDRIRALLLVWGPIGELSARSCHDPRFICNTPKEAIAAIQVYRQSFCPEAATPEPSENTVERVEPADGGVMDGELERLRARVANLDSHKEPYTPQERAYLVGQYDCTRARLRALKQMQEEARTQKNYVRADVLREALALLDLEGRYV